MQTDALVFLVFRNSAMMVLVGGAATTAVLFVVAFASVWFRNKELPASLKPSPSAPSSSPSVSWPSSRWA